MSSPDPSPSPSTSNTQNPHDCLPCRVTGFATFSGLGAYLLYEARIVSRAGGGNVLARRATLGAFGLGSVLLGMYRLAN
ncbi:hypothetical protein M427DRAFT_64342 [Gonapodya prolifera JEL478]|uniref:Distal membrane-arm assembly complex protein 1-like domain-containing protein n=1 Tax=Gonapodya prolifera (strain JEL478) TaxID=1344416 RepID=A0A138ZYG2_GONPJ|nr:hypothetical protein M427DRAFT_64342 [Gonapodya prolifera JEL478]|eukprot:KXS09305.1 hypothetical protein M427DRAFT_64342 [Gonapodya prolifera JEL478]